MQRIVARLTMQMPDDRREITMSEPRKIRERQGRLCKSSINRF